ncbi:MAG: DUF411 domain-containing protein [bacterium]|nr:DUF411 domain-containing protein [bacterium]
MNKYAGIALIAFIVIIVFGFVFSSGPITGSSDKEAIASAVLHKDPNCGCCGVYGSYLSRLNYDVSINSTSLIDEVKDNLGVPDELLSCHTMEIEGYVVEGHIPVEAIEKLLEERPEIKGIGMAGMPAGSPGMGGTKQGQFMIYEIHHDGSAGGLFMAI